MHSIELLPTGKIICMLFHQRISANYPTYHIAKEGTPPEAESIKLVLSPVSRYVLSCSIYLYDYYIRVFSSLIKKIG